MKRALVALLLVAGPAAAQAQEIIAGHAAAAEFFSIPQEWLDAAKQNLKVGYAHTSHGHQIYVGMQDLVGEVPPLNVSFTSQSYAYPFGAEGIARCIGDNYINDPSVMVHNYKYCLGDLGNYPLWIDHTNDPLLRPARARNVVVWSWGCELSSKCADGSHNVHNTTELQDWYLTPMMQFEADHPDVTFVYMTGQLDGLGSSGQLHRLNEHIRNFVRENNRILYDFADVERYDPAGVDYLDRGGGYNTNGDGDGCRYGASGEFNWCVDWCTTHPGDCVNLTTSCDHSHRLNCRLKGKAFWWLMARLAGWPGVGGSADTTAPAAVTDLAAGACGPTSCPLTWTAPGDDGATGTAHLYDMRYSTTAITAANFSSATPASGEPLPHAAGTGESMTLSGLAPSTRYYFALKTRDEASNWSAISNLPSGTTQAAPDTTPPSPVTGFSAAAGNTQVSLTWTHSASGDNKGTLVRFKSTGYPTGPTDGTVACDRLGGPSTAGSCLHSGLTNGTTYYYAAYSYDAAANYGSGVNASATPAAPQDPPTVQDLRRSDTR